MDNASIAKYGSMALGASLVYQILLTPGPKDFISLGWLIPSWSMVGVAVLFGLGIAVFLKVISAAKDLIFSGLEKASKSAAKINIKSLNKGKHLAKSKSKHSLVNLGYIANNQLVESRRDEVEQKKQHNSLEQIQSKFKQR